MSDPIEVSMISENRSHATNEVVVAYFTRSEDAQRAIDDLVTEGFASRQIGAAFRSRIGTAPTGIDTVDSSPEGTGSLRATYGSDSLGSGPASGTSAVTPSGLSTGSGSVVSGAGRPGPIPGSEIPHHRETTEVETTKTVANPMPATGGFHESRDENNWWNKLKHIFSSDSEKSSRSEGIVDSTSMNFGTGEGHLATYPEAYDYAYSGSAFEGAFSGMGLPQQHARTLVGEMRNGGAIVSVSASGRIADAEKILERNNGRVRYEAASTTSTWQDVPGERVHVFGELSRTYPGYLKKSDTIQRKAS